MKPFLPILLCLLFIGCSGKSGRFTTTPSKCLADTACSVPIICAHRGICSDEPENTLAAFLSCEASGVPMLEIDTRETSGGEVVLMHDDTVSRTTDGERRFPGRVKVTELSLGEFKSLVIDDPRCTGTTGDNLDRCRPPTFAELLDRTGKETLLFIDFKAGDAARLAAVVKAADAAGRVILFDSNIQSLRAFRAALPGALVMPRVHNAAETQALLKPENSDLDLRWIHGEPGGLIAEIAAVLRGTGIRLYVDTFVNVDLMLGAASLVPDPKERAELEAEAWAELVKQIGQGASGFGTNLGAQISTHLYPRGFGWAE